MDSCGPDARRQEVKRHLVRVLLEVLGVLDSRQRVQIHDAVHAVVVVLQRHVVLDGTQVVAEMLAPGWTGAGEDTTLLCHRSAFHHLVDQADDLAGLRMPVGLQLGVHQPIVDGHFKATAIRRNERDPLDQVLEMLEQLTCQAHGPVGVVSDRAVDDFDSQHTPSPSKKQARGPAAP